jgi:hypothetical protein
MYSRILTFLTGLLIPGIALAQEFPIRFLIPLPGSPSCNPNAPLGVFECYFNAMYPWAVGTAAGVAVLMVLVGGIQIIQSEGDQGKRQEGITRLRTAIIGLMLIIFSTIILQTLNPTFFK